MVSDKLKIKRLLNIANLRELSETYHIPYNILSNLKTNPEMMINSKFRAELTHISELELKDIKKNILETPNYFYIQSEEFGYYYPIEKAKQINFYSLTSDRQQFWKLKTSEEWETIRDYIQFKTQGIFNGQEEFNMNYFDYHYTDKDNLRGIGLNSIPQIHVTYYMPTFKDYPVFTTYRFLCNYIESAIINGPELYLELKPLTQRIDGLEKLSVALDKYVFRPLSDPSTRRKGLHNSYYLFDQNGLNLFQLALEANEKSLNSQNWDAEKFITDKIKNIQFN